MNQISFPHFKTYPETDLKYFNKYVISGLLCNSVHFCTLLSKLFLTAQDIHLLVIINL